MQSKLCQWGAMDERRFANDVTKALGCVRCARPSGITASARLRCKPSSVVLATPRGTRSRCRVRRRNRLNRPAAAGAVSQPAPTTAGFLPGRTSRLQRWIHGANYGALAASPAFRSPARPDRPFTFPRQPAATAFCRSLQPLVDRHRRRTLDREWAAPVTPTFAPAPRNVTPQPLVRSSTQAGTRRACPPITASGPCALPPAASRMRRPNQRRLPTRCMWPPAASWHLALPPYFRRHAARPAAPRGHIGGHSRARRSP